MRWWMDEWMNWKMNKWVNGWKWEGIEQSNNDGLDRPCKGDAGGPLTTVDKDKDTLIGIISGGVGCGKGVPSWYTRVSHHEKWFRCIIEMSRKLNNNQKKVEEACRESVQSEPKCVDPNNLIFGEEAFRKYQETVDTKRDLCPNPKKVNQQGQQDQVTPRPSFVPLFEH